METRQGCVSGLGDSDVTFWIAFTEGWRPNEYVKRGWLPSPARAGTLHGPADGGRRWR